MTLCRAGIQHRVWMTGYQPEQDQPLPRPALLPNVPLEDTLEQMFLSCQGVFSVRVRFRVMDVGEGSFDLNPFSR